MATNDPPRKKRKYAIQLERSFAIHPKARFWSDKNELRPEDVALHSHTKFLFDCPDCGHSFERICRDVSRGSWCPYCSNHKRCGQRDCVVCFEHSFASHPYSAQWSVNNELSPIQVSKGSGTKYKFNCEECHHEYEAPPYTIIKGSRCPYCCGKKVCGNPSCQPCFEKSFASHPKAQFWSDKNDLLPIQVTKGNYKKWWFWCPDCGHSFETTCESVKYGSWCRYCKGVRWRHCGDDDCSHCFQRSFASHPMASMWSTKNDDDPLYVARSSSKYRWFDCEKCGESWKATLNSIFGGSGCPNCKHKSEKKCQDFLKTTFGFSNVVSGGFEWCKNPKTQRRLAFDMTIQSKRIICECDGPQHFKPVPYFNYTMTFEEICARDEYKERCAIENGYSVIRVKQMDIFKDKDWRQRLIDAIESVEMLKPCVIKLY